MDENSSEFGVRLKDKAFKENKKRPKEKLQALLEELDCELKVTFSSIQLRTR